MVEALQTRVTRADAGRAFVSGVSIAGEARNGNCRNATSTGPAPASQNRSAARPDDTNGMVLCHDERHFVDQAHLSWYRRFWLDRSVQGRCVFSALSFLLLHR